MGLALPVAAQVSTGTIEINTVDEQALPMPGVTGRVVNTATGAQRASVSDVAGLIIIPALPPGEYNVGVELDGICAGRQGHHDPHRPDRKVGFHDEGTDVGDHYGDR